MKAKSIKGFSPQEIQKYLEESMADGFNPTLAVVFLSVEQDRKTICEVLNEKGLVVFGATTCGEFIDGQFSNGGTAILLLEISSGLFSLYYEPEAEKDTRIKVRKLAEKALEQFKNPAFVVAGSGLRVDGEFVIRGIEDAAGNDTIIYGGLAGDDLKMKETIVFTNNKSSKEGIVMLAFDGDKIAFKGRATHGVKGVGTLKTITKAEGWWIHTLDDQPALDLVAKYMGIEIEKKGEISPIPPDFEIIDDVVNDCREVKVNELQEADALIMFSCVGRLSALGPLISDEIEGVKNTFNVPMAGFFSYGEFGRATNGNHEFHNLTCCWFAIKEK